MRLTANEQNQIKHIIAEVFGNNARLMLFGSRVDDSKRGGDVDLYVTQIEQGDLYSKRIACLGKLEAVLPYPVDLVVDDGVSDLAIYRVARSEGVVL